MFEHARKQNEAGNDVVIVEVSGGGGGGGGYYSPNYIRVAEIERGTEYTKINASNVKKDIAEYEFNFYAGRHGNSNYQKCLDAATKDFEEATATKAEKSAEFVFEKGDNENER
ncbi:MAG: hypothetical protein M0Z50_09875 [Planctomycetia bacterium]|jgi:hypothetical protein|nr:hypothetical protein [Planctomycetia bacterium]